MANVVDILIRARDEASAQVRKVAAEVGGLSGTVQGLTTGLGVWGALAAGAVAAGAAVVAAGKRYADLVEDLDRVAGATGATIEQVQILEHVFQDAGLQTRDAELALSNLGRAIGRGDPLLARLGVTSRNSYEALLQLGDAFSRTADTATKQEAAQKLLSEGGLKALGVITRLRSESERMEKQLRRSNALIGEDSVGAARDLDRAITNLNIRFEGFRNQIAQNAAPAAVELIDQLEALIDLMGRLGRLPPVRLGVEVVGSALDVARFNDEIKLLQQNILAIANAPSEAGTAIGNLLRTRDAAAFAQEVREIGASFDEVATAAGIAEERIDKMLQKRGVSLAPRAPVGFEEAAARAAAEGAGGGVGVTDPEVAATLARLEQIEKLLGVNRRQAEALLAVLKQADEDSAISGLAKKVQGLLETEVEVTASEIMTALELVERTGIGILTTLRALREETTTLEPRRPAGRPAPEGPSGPVTDPGVRTSDAGEAPFGPRESGVRGAEAMSEALIDVSIQWGEVVQSMLSQAALLNEGFAAVYNGLQSGFQQVFVSVLEQGQTFRSAFTTIFKTLAAEVLAALARIAASKIFAIVVSLIPGLGPFVGAGVSALGPTGAPTGVGRTLYGSAASPTGAAGARVAPAAVTNINIQSWSTRDALMQIALPFGELRSAQRRLAAGRAY